MAEKVNVEVDESGNPFVVKADGKRFRLYQKGSTYGLKTAVAPRGHGKFIIEINTKTNKMVCKPKASEDKIKGAKYAMYMRNGLLMCRRQLPPGVKAPKEEKQEQEMVEDEIMTNAEEEPATEPEAEAPKPPKAKIAKPAAPVPKAAPKKAAVKKTPMVKKVIAKK